MKRLNEAYAVLSDIDRRGNYDAALKANEKEQSQQTGSHKPTETDSQSSQSRSPPESRTRYTETKRNAAATSDREKREGKSRFDPSNGNSTTAYTEHMRPNPVATNVFTACFSGFSDERKDRQTPSPASISEATSPKQVRFNVWHCVGLCLIGAWFLALGTATRLKTGHSELPPYKLLFDIGFLGMVASPLFALLAAAFVGSLFALATKRTRPLAAAFGATTAAALLVMLFIGGQIGEARIKNSSPAPTIPAYTQLITPSAPNSSKAEQRLDPE